MTILGINTHIDFAFKGSPYLDINNVTRCVQYLGVKHLRDCASNADTVAKWVAVTRGTGAKFCAYLPEAGPADVARCFGYWPTLYRNGLIDMFEGPNEPDDAYAARLGNSVAEAADFMKRLAPYTKGLAKPLINLSVGAGWSAANNWDGDYDSIPPMGDICDFGNAHTYPNLGAGVVSTMQRINGLAAKSVPGKPVITTELGWDMRHGHTQAQIVTDIKAAVESNLSPYIYLYALFDDQSGQFGLFENDGTPRAAAEAVRQIIGAKQ